jgi:hypothetical protein
VGASVTAHQPDTRTPGQVLCEALLPAMESRWPGLSESYQARYEVAAGTLLAHDAAQRAARGEVVVPRMHVETLISVAEEFNPRLTHQTRSELQAAIAAPAPKETDR